MTKNTEQLVNQTYKPTVMEIVELAEEIEAAGLGQIDLVWAALARWGNQPAPPAEGEVRELVAWLRTISKHFRLDQLGDEADRTDRAADLLEQRHPTPVPQGEVAELVAWLRMQGEAQKPGPNSLLSGRTKNEQHAAGMKLTRAADLLERHPAPVPVAERLPGPEDCDAEGRCWLLTVEDEYPQWRLHSIEGSQPGGSTMVWVPVDSSSGVMVDAFYASHWFPFNALPLPQGEVQ